MSVDKFSNQPGGRSLNTSGYKYRYSDVPWDHKLLEIAQGKSKFMTAQGEPKHPRLCLKSRK